MAKDPLKPPVPDMLFHTIPGKPVNPAYFEVADGGVGAFGDEGLKALRMLKR